MKLKTHIRAMRSTRATRRGGALVLTLTLAALFAVPAGSGAQSIGDLNAKIGRASCRERV